MAQKWTSTMLWGKDNPLTTLPSLCPPETGPSCPLLGRRAQQDGMVPRGQAGCGQCSVSLELHLEGSGKEKGPLNPEGERWCYWSKVGTGQAVPQGVVQVGVLPRPVSLCFSKPLSD